MEGVLIPYPCKSKRRYPLSLNVVRTLLLKFREHAGGGATGKTALFVGKNKKCLPQIFLATFMLKIKRV